MFSLLTDQIFQSWQPRWGWFFQSRVSIALPILISVVNTLKHISSSGIKLSWRNLNTEDHLCQEVCPWLTFRKSLSDCESLPVKHTVYTLLQHCPNVLINSVVSREGFLPPLKVLRAGGGLLRVLCPSYYTLISPIICGSGNARPCDLTANIYFAHFSQRVWPLWWCRHGGTCWITCHTLSVLWTRWTH